MGMMSFLQWSLATAIAAVSGTFFLLTYVHAHFVGVSEFKGHGHKDLVREARYTDDLNDLRNRLESLDGKLDRVLTAVDPENPRSHRPR